MRVILGLLKGGIIGGGLGFGFSQLGEAASSGCLLYTSDAADDLA
mgnify:CR=1 FL=1